MGAHSIPSDLLEEGVELGFVLITHVLEQFEGAGHGEADRALAIDDGVVAVAGEDLQWWVGVAPVVTKEVGLSFETRSFSFDDFLFVLSQH